MRPSFKQVIVSPSGPPPVGPYSPCCRAGDYYFFSGQIGVQADGTVYGETAAEQTWQALINLTQSLAAAELEMHHIVKTTIFLTDMADFAAVNEVYAQFFSEPYPARSTVQVAALPLGLKVEVEAVAWYHM
jgi:2-iminobutanoate/2-iminopropanoate deaminase